MDRELEIGIFQLFAEIAPSVIWVEVRFKSVLYIQSKRVIFTPGESLPESGVQIARPAPLPPPPPL